MKVSSNFTAFFCFLVLSSSVSAAAAADNNKKKRRKHRTRGLSSEQKKRDLLNKNLLTGTWGFNWDNIFVEETDSVQWYKGSNDDVNTGNSGKGGSTGKGGNRDRDLELRTETGGFDWGNVFADNGVDSFQWHPGNSGKGFSTGKGATGGGGGGSTGKGYGGGRTRGRDLKKHNTGRIRSF